MVSPLGLSVGSYVKIHQLDVGSHSLFVKKLLEDAHFDVLAGVEDVDSNFVSRCKVKAVPETDLVVKIVYGFEAKIRAVLHHGVYVEVSF